MTGISSVEAKALFDAGGPLYVLDVRGPEEFKENQLGRGETHIPLGQLRKRVDELPQDKNATIVSFCKVSMRGYEAQRILENAGYTDVRVMEGGLMAWPFTGHK